MRRDSIFYRLFQQSPHLLFELLETPPTNASAYRFDSVAVKEPKFEIDGVFLPPDTESGSIYFCEVQFQKDDRLYERLFGEAFLYFYRHRDRFADWQAVVIYPARNLEQSNTYPYRSLLNSDQVHRVYLQELGNIRQLPLGIALMVLTIIEDTQAAEEARYLLERSRQETPTPEVNRAMIETITTIMVYRFTQLSRQEIEAMLGLRLQETRVYQEAKEEGREEGEQIGFARGEKALLLRQLARRVGELPEPVRSRIDPLPINQLEALGEALLDFVSLSDLEAWLSQTQAE